MTSVKHQNDTWNEEKCVLYCQGVIKEVAEIMIKHEWRWNNLLVVCSLLKNVISVSLMNGWYPVYSGFSSSTSLMRVTHYLFWFR